MVTVSTSSRRAPPPLDETPRKVVLRWGKYTGVVYICIWYQKALHDWNWMLKPTLISRRTGAPETTEVFQRLWITYHSHLVLALFLGFKCVCNYARSLSWAMALSRISQVKMSSCIELEHNYRRMKLHTNRHGALKWQSEQWIAWLCS